MGPFIMMAIALILLVVISFQLQKCFASLRWPSTRGRIIQFDINQNPEVGGYEADPSQPLPKCMHAAYEYKVNGVTYQCSRKEFLTGSSSFISVGKGREHQYAEGKSVTVYYNRRNPKEACLKPGAGMGALVGFVVPLIFIAIGIVWMLNE